MLKRQQVSETWHTVRLSSLGTPKVALITKEKAFGYAKRFPQISCRSPRVHRSFKALMNRLLPEYDRRVCRRVAPGHGNTCYFRTGGSAEGIVGVRSPRPGLSPFNAPSQTCVADNAMTEQIFLVESLIALRHSTDARAVVERCAV